MRPLRQEEIDTLQRQNCTATDWDQIAVSEDFTATALRSVHFSGQIRLGRMEGKTDPGDGIARSCGIYNSRLINCTVGDNVHIHSVGLLSGYDIGSRVVIEHTAYLCMSGESAFGQGTPLALINEAGGRECPMYDRLSAQIAYLMSMGRHDSALIGQLNKLISDYADRQKSHRGTIGQGAAISNCGTIRNVRIGSFARIEGASLVEEGSIAGSEQDPVRIGAGVVARHFIVQSGSHIESGALLHHCFVGQGVRMGKQFSAEHSAFFANCEGFHGEACSVFAGPYSVSHHKSTLLIAGLYSFYNAGSGTNQSNHMYKLGPLHQGVVERGAKTGSFAYMMWPSHVGAFSVVTGKHAGGFDASEFPFSYITVDDDRSLLTPAMNLFTVGTRRDSDKWPKRDRRKDKEKYDLLHFDFLNPFIIGKVMRAREVLDALHTRTPKEQESVYYKGLRIKRLMLKTTRKYYDMTIPIYLGGLLAGRMEDQRPESAMDLAELLKSDRPDDGQLWLDIAGMLVPEKVLQQLLDQVGSGAINSIEALEGRLREIHADFGSYQWSWVLDLMDREYGIRASALSPEAVESLLAAWRDNAVRLNNMILKDAEKEFDPGSRIAYGLIGGEEERNRDFESVRGSFETNAFAASLRKESEEITARASVLIDRVRTWK